MQPLASLCKSDSVGQASPDEACLFYVQQCAISIATSVAPGVADTTLVRVVPLAEGRVLVAVLESTGAIGHTDDGTQPIEEVVILLPIRGAFVVEQSTATAYKLGRAGRGGRTGQAQSAIDEAISVDLDALALGGPTVGVAGTPHTGGLVLIVIGRAGSSTDAGQVPDSVIAIGDRTATVLAATGELVGGVIGIAVRGIPGQDRATGHVAIRIIAVLEIVEVCWLPSSILPSVRRLRLS